MGDNNGGLKATEPGGGGFDARARIISIAVLVLILLTIWYMLTLVLLTFIMVFIFYRLLGVIRRYGKRIFLSKIPDAVVIPVLYVIFVALLAVVSIKFAPKLAVQITDIAEIIRNFDFENVINSLAPRYADILSGFDITPYISGMGSVMLSWLSWFGGFSVNFFIALLLSLLLLLEKGKISNFGAVLEQSRIAFLYRYLVNFGGNFAKTFAKVMDVQIMIAFINCVLSVIALSIMGFPQIMGLGIMIFLFGLIPVAGVVVSLIPLSVVAFNIGGFTKVLAVLIMVAAIHVVEAYVLNPKLMSQKTALPVSFVLIILVVAEHYLQVWGLIIGVPLFIFLLNIFEVDFEEALKHEKKFFRGRRGGKKPRAENEAAGTPADQ
jgi:predicted PurR-regulated permease PerM